MFAIIRAAGKQYRIAQGDVVRFEKMAAEPGETCEINEVLAIGEDEGNVTLGRPTVEGAKVQGTVIRHGKDKKIIVFKRKRRKGYRKKQGHRQMHTMIRIDSISA